MAEGIVYHPTFPDVVRRGLTEQERQAHKRVGWRLTPLPAEKAGAEPADPKPSGRKSVINTDD